VHRAARIEQRLRSSNCTRPCAARGGAEIHASPPSSTKQSLPKDRSPRTQRELIVSKFSYAALGPAHSAVNWQEVEHCSRRCCELVSKIWVQSLASTVHKGCLRMTCRRTITPSSFITPSMLRTLTVSYFLPPKTKSEVKEVRNDSLFFRATVSYYSRNWCPL